MLNHTVLGSSCCITVLDVSSGVSALAQADILGWRAGIPAGNTELSE